MSQTEKLYELLKDGRPHRTDEILRVVYGSSHNGIARIGARISDLKNGKWSQGIHCRIIGWHDANTSALYWYQLEQTKMPVMPPAFEVQPVEAPAKLNALFI